MPKLNHQSSYQKCNRLTNTSDKSVKGCLHFPICQLGATPSILHSSAPDCLLTPTHTHCNSSALTCEVTWHYTTSLPLQQLLHRNEKKKYLRNKIFLCTKKTQVKRRKWHAIYTIMLQPWQIAAIDWFRRYSSLLVVSKCPKTP